MALNRIRVFIAVASLLTVAATSTFASDKKEDSAPWRKSFEIFVKAIDQFPANDVPPTKTEVGYQTGKRVGADVAIMKRFGGTVEFEGVFEGIIAADSPIAPENKKEKIDISMAWPSGTGPNIDWKLHLYPKDGTLKAWKALKPKTTIQFRAVVTGITTFDTWLDPHLRGISILLEDGEIVSKQN